MNSNIQHINIIWLDRYESVSTWRSFQIWFVPRGLAIPFAYYYSAWASDHSFEMSNYIYVNKYVSHVPKTSFWYNIFTNRIFINRYRSTWYKMPIKIQKILHTMQMRASKSCKLTRRRHIRNEHWEFWNCAYLLSVA